MNKFEQMGAAPAEEGQELEKKVEQFRFTSQENLDEALGQFEEIKNMPDGKKAAAGEAWDFAIRLAKGGKIKEAGSVAKFLHEADPEADEQTLLKNIAEINSETGK